MHEIPTRPASPRAEEPRRRSWLGLGIMVAFLVGTLALLALLSPGLVLIVAAVLTLVGLNYLLWGWWLGPALRREVEEEEQRPS